MRVDVVPELEIIEDLFDETLLEETVLVATIDRRLLSPERPDWISKCEIDVEEIEDLEIEEGD
jgi:hypothetical protein